MRPEAHSKEWQCLKYYDIRPGIDFIDLWWVLWNRFVVGALYSKDSRW